ncbi:MAG: DUF2934 domain-containing protein [Gemmataceae bacterium]|nr:DUF2934 domain-containing protein [Gemmataceae bacterium]
MRKKSATADRPVPPKPPPEARAAAAGRVETLGPGPTVSAEAIRLLAYRKWEVAGRPTGDGINFWLEAERELLPAR